MVFNTPKSCRSLKLFYGEKSFKKSLSLFWPKLLLVSFFMDNKVLAKFRNIWVISLNLALAFHSSVKALKM